MIIFSNVSSDILYVRLRSDTTIFETYENVRDTLGFPPKFIDKLYLEIESLKVNLGAVGCSQVLAAHELYVE